MCVFVCYPMYRILHINFGFIKSNLHFIDIDLKELTMESVWNLWFNQNWRPVLESKLVKKIGLIKTLSVETFVLLVNNSVIYSLCVLCAITSGWVEE
jgi:hypothetical protein